MIAAMRDAAGDGGTVYSPHQYLPLIAERLIDFVRVRISKGGGITAARKIATLGYRCPRMADHAVAAT